MRIDQQLAAATAPAVFRETPAEVRRLASVFANAGVATRYSCMPVDWYTADTSWQERNDLYLEHGETLLAAAAERCLAAAGLAADAVDHIVAVSSTGVATPSLEARLLDRLPFRRDVRRLPIFGLGCAGGVIGLSRAAAIARAYPGETVLLLVLELCALTFRRNDRSSSNIVATALFGDGAAAALIGTGLDGGALTAGGEWTWPASRDIMGWTVLNDGLGVVFSREIPDLVRERFRPALDRFLAANGLTLADVDRYFCHPGGARVLDALEESLGLPAGGLVLPRAVLRDVGNVSAVTVYFILERALAAGDIGRRALITALGPGFTVAFQLLESAV